MNTKRTAAARSAGTEDETRKRLLEAMGVDDTKEVLVCDDPGIEFRVVPGIRPLDIDDPDLVARIKTEIWSVTQNQRGEVLEITGKHFRPAKNRA